MTFEEETMSFECCFPLLCPDKFERQQRLEIQNGYVETPSNGAKNIDEISDTSCEQLYLTEQQIQHYSRQLIDAVQYIHNKGYLHLDIKPQNIMIDE